MKTPFLSISIGNSQNLSQNKQTRRCFLCFVWSFAKWQQKKRSSTTTKDLFGKFPKNSQNYKEEKGGSCYIWRLDCCKSLELGRCLRGKTSCPIKDNCHLVWNDVTVVAYHVRTKLIIFRPLWKNNTNLSCGAKMRNINKLLRIIQCETQENRYL